MIRTYRSRGSVRGDCGHAHRSLYAAERCRLRDQRACTKQGGYSDRAVERTDGEFLSLDEQDCLDDLWSAL